MEKDLEVIGANFLTIQICCIKDMDRNKIEHLSNVEYLCGTINGWILPSEEQYNKITESITPDTVNGEVVCSENPDRRHWILTC